MTGLRKDAHTDMDSPSLTPSADFSGKQVLVAEDNMANQLVLKKLLKKVSVTPVFANNGQEVVDLYKSDHEKWDLVLMDCEMPVMDGYMATETIRQFEQESNLAKGNIVGLSAHAITEFRNKALGKGMDDYLTKPIDRDLLYKTLAEYLG